MTFSFGHATGRRPPFKYSAFTRVGFSDTDAQGIVYYGRYLPYFDYARVEYSRHLGVLDYALAPHEFVMRACDVDYEAPARFDDLLEVFVRTKRLGRSSMTTELCVVPGRGRRAHVHGRRRRSCWSTRPRGEPSQIPDGYREAIERFEGADLEAAVAG